MIRFIQIDENEIFNKQEKEILQKHLNDVFRHINAFMICMVPGFIPEEHIPPVLKNDALVKNPTTHAGDEGSIPGSRRSPGEEMATCSSVLAWKTPWTEEPGGLQTMESRKSWM